MINLKENYVEWALWANEINDAKEHLENLINNIDDDDFDENNLRVELGHIYAHLNRIWNSKDHVGDMSTKKWEEYSEFPSDIE